MEAPLPNLQKEVFAWQTNNSPLSSTTSQCVDCHLTSFFTDISSEMVINLLPLFLANVLGVRTSLIGLIEGLAESAA
ncbi:MAG: hypothetical protein R3E31_24185 [Chloroflexota bacterium]